MEPLSFKHFFEMVEKEPNAIDTIQDELGIDSEDMEDAMEKNPGWASGISAKEITYKGKPYEIVGFTKQHGEITGANIRLFDSEGLEPQQGYRKHKGKHLRVPDSSAPKEVIWIPKKTLNDLMNTGLTSSDQAGGLPG